MLKTKSREIGEKEIVMKKLFSAFLSAILILSCASFAYAAENGPTTEELESVIKLVRTRIDIPEEFSEFTWKHRSANAYQDESWVLTWKNKNDAPERGSATVECDGDGHIIDFTMYFNNQKYGQLPKFTKDELLKTAEEFLQRVNPTLYENLKLSDASSAGIYSNRFSYNFVRYIDGYLFADNTANVSVDYTTGKVMSFWSEYDYDLEIARPENIITPEKAAEILGTRQKMVLKYRTKLVTDENSGERKVKAYLVYVPEISYIAVDAGTGEIYDSKSLWEVGNMGAAGGSSNITMDKNMSATEGAVEEDYRLTEQEKAGLAELEGLISKEQAIKAVAENKALYLDPALTAVDAVLSKNTGILKTTAYQNDNGKYVWNISFSNPVFDDKYYSNAYANATVNAENGKLVSFYSNLNDYYYYSENKLDIPDVKYDAEQAREIGEKFLESVIPEKFSCSVKVNVYSENLINFRELPDKKRENLYGAFRFRYDRVNEDIEFSQNNIYVGVDGVTGKVYNFGYNWYTNVEFESPKGAITPEMALSYLVSYDGYGINYEKNTVHIYNPVSESSKKDVCAAFTASLITTLESGGDIDKVIDKYAKDIDREKLKAILAERKDSELLEFISAYFGVSTEETEKAATEYIDTSLFYDKEVEARLVYSNYGLGSTYISPFTGKQLDYNGEEYVKKAVDYTYDDLQGHWIEKTATLLADVEIGFEGGKFQPDKVITALEFTKLSQAMSMYTEIGTGDAELDKISAVRAILNAYGYEKVAKIQGIYKTDFADNDTIKDEDIGYTAIAFGLGIVKGDGMNADVYSKLTRAQALSLLVNAMSLTR